MQENNLQDQVPPVPPIPDEVSVPEKTEKKADVLPEVVKKIKEAENVLVALSNDPSVDEMAAAMGLTMALDAAGKHATAIYSGKTPNVLEFLKPEETFEVNTDSLQDFIIALNKDKADHLRYKIDGDFVKVYITPYKTTIAEDDLEFSRGDFNIDLVISLNVPAATELDGALKEHGRIMHDATAVNITNGAEGKFGDLEWVDDKASSISEMVTNLALELNGKKLDSGIATALLTGLIAATDKFTNPSTTPEVMMMAAKLMGFGADQQVIIQNVSQELEFNERTDIGSDDEAGLKKHGANELSISHDSDDEEKSEETPDEQGSESDLSADESSEKTDEIPGGGALAAQANSGAQDDVQALMQSAINPMGTSNAAPGATTIAGVEVSSVSGDNAGYAGGALADQILNNLNNSPASEINAAPNYGQMIDQALAEPLPGEAPAGPEMVASAGSETNPMMSPAMVAPDTGMPPMPSMGEVGPELGPNPTMLANPGGPSADEVEAMNIIKQAQAGNVTETPSLNMNGEMPKIIPTGGSIGYDAPTGAENVAQGMTMNPAMAQAPGVENMPAVNDVPTMNFGMGGETQAGMPGPQSSPAVVMPEGTGMASNPLPMPGQELAPPPMTPTPDFGAMPPVQTVPTNLAPDPTQMASMTPPAAPAMQAPQATDPGAFQIPGMQQ